MAIEVTNEQPLKLASMEGLWQSTSCAPMYLAGWVDTASQTTSGISIPCLLSFLAYQDINATVAGIESFAPAPTPPINLLFQAYHFMLSVGSLLVPIGLLGGLMFLWGARGCTDRASCCGCSSSRCSSASWRSPPAGGRPRSAASRGSSTTCSRPPTASRRSLTAADVVTLARDVHRPVLAVAGPLPVPDEQARSRTGRRSSRTSRRPTSPACRTRSGRSSAAAGDAADVESEPMSLNDDLVRAVHRHHRRLPDPRRLRHGGRDPAPAARPRPTPSAGPSSTASARSGTATRSGWSSAAASCSPSSRSPTRRCSRASTSRSCWSCW